MNTTIQNVTILIVYGLLAAASSHGSVVVYETMVPSNMPGMFVHNVYVEDMDEFDMPEGRECMGCPMSPFGVMPPQFPPPGMPMPGEGFGAPPMSMPPDTGVQPPMMTQPEMMIPRLVEDAHEVVDRPPVAPPHKRVWQGSRPPSRPPKIQQKQNKPPPNPPKVHRNQFLPPSDQHVVSLNRYLPPPGWREEHVNDIMVDFDRPDAPETILQEIKIAYKNRDADRLMKLAEAMLTYSQASKYQKAEAFLYTGAMHYLEGDVARAHTCFKKAVKMASDIVPDNEIRTSGIMDAFIRARKDEIGK